MASKKKKLIVNSLHAKINDELRNEYKKLGKACGWNFGERNDTDFFEQIYRILHLKYRCAQNELRSLQAVSNFFKSYEWLIGHYLKNFLSIVMEIHRRKGLSFDEKLFYIDKLKCQSTYDEVRLIFYYVISLMEEADEKIEVLKMFDQYRFFEGIKKLLVYPEDWPDYQLLLTSE